ncbi:MAG: 30S ribosomal protein S4e [Candidatus Bathyarchaeota archaeon]|nr:30S ribosomal protein S4e [Candidatus Bathyarchaeota archaeon]
MGKKGKTGRLKRNPAPRIWPIHRKESLWVVKPSSGPHSLENCLPLALVLRDILKVAETRKEAKKIISQGKIYVDGKIRRKDDFPVGLMDVISIPELNKFFRVAPCSKGLFLNPIGKEESNFKLCRVEDQTTVRKGHVQIALHDGSNILAKKPDSENPQEVEYETFDVLKLSLPEKQVLAQIKTKEGTLAVITGGKNIGKQGRIVEIEKTEAKKRRNALVIIEDEKGNRYQTILDFVFSLGTTQPLTSQAEAAPHV